MLSSIVYKHFSMLYQEWLFSTIGNGIPEFIPRRGSGCVSLSWDCCQWNHCGQSTFVPDLVPLRIWRLSQYVHHAICVQQQGLATLQYLVEISLHRLYHLVRSTIKLIRLRLDSEVLSLCAWFSRIDADMVATLATTVSVLSLKQVF